MCNKIKILLVDDNSLDQKLILTVITKLDIKADIAETEEIALEKLHNQDYDLVLIDSNKITKHLIENLKKQTPILTIASNSIPANKEKHLRIGENNFLIRPFTEKAFTEKIIDMLMGKALFKNQFLTSNILDLNFFNTCSLGNPEIQIDLISIFLEISPTYLKLLDQSINDENYILIKENAHFLKSSFLTMGIKGAKELYQLELMALKHEKTSDYSDIFDKTMEDYLEAVWELDLILKKLLIKKLL